MVTMEFDITKLRRFMHIKLDLFDDHSFKETEEDKKLLDDMAETIKYASKTCFKRCINMNNIMYTDQEEQCNKQCVDGMMSFMESVILKYKVTKPE